MLGDNDGAVVLGDTEGCVVVGAIDGERLGDEVVGVCDGTEVVGVCDGSCVGASVPQLFTIVFRIAQTPDLVFACTRVFRSGCPQTARLGMVLFTTTGSPSTTPPKLGVNQSKGRCVVLTRVT